MAAAMKVLMKNRTWELVERPEGIKLIGNKWVYEIKHRRDGCIDRFVANFVTKSINYLKIKQFNVTLTFLNGDLDEKIYMTQP